MGGDGDFSLLGRKPCEKAAECSSPEVEPDAAPFFFFLFSSKSSGYFHKLKGMNITCRAVVASLVPSPSRNEGRPLTRWRRIGSVVSNGSGHRGVWQPFRQGSAVGQAAAPPTAQQQRVFISCCKCTPCAAVQAWRGTHPLHQSCRIMKRPGVLGWGRVGGQRVGGRHMGVQRSTY